MGIERNGPQTSKLTPPNSVSILVPATILVSFLLLTHFTHPLLECCLFLCLSLDSHRSNEFQSLCLSFFSLYCFAPLSLSLSAGCRQSSALFRSIFGTSRQRLLNIWDFSGTLERIFVSCSQEISSTICPYGLSYNSTTLFSLQGFGKDRSRSDTGIPCSQKGTES